MKIIRPPLFMRPNPESDLEQAIDRELRGLPELRAPEDLLPRVLELALERGRRPWWQKSFVHWPWMARCLFLAVTTALSGLAVYFTWGVSIGLPFESLSGEIAVLTERFAAVRSIAGSLGGALVAVGKSAGPWLPWTVAGMMGMSYLTTLALGTYCYRLASSRI